MLASEFLSCLVHFFQRPRFLQRLLQQCHPVERSLSFSAQWLLLVQVFPIRGSRQRIFQSGLVHTKTKSHFTLLTIRDNANAKTIIFVLSNDKFCSNLSNISFKLMFKGRTRVEQIDHFNPKCSQMHRQFSEFSKNRFKNWLCILLR